MPPVRKLFHSTYCKWQKRADKQTRKSLSASLQYGPNNNKHSTIKNENKTTTAKHELNFFWIYFSIQLVTSIGLGTVYGWNQFTAVSNLTLSQYLLTKKYVQKLHNIWKPKCSAFIPLTPYTNISTMFRLLS